MSDIEAEELVLVRLQEREPHLVHALRVEVPHVLDLVRTVEEDTEEVVVSLHDALDDARTSDELGVDLERTGDEHAVADVVRVVRRVDLPDGGDLGRRDRGLGGRGCGDLILDLDDADDV